MNNTATGKVSLLAYAGPNAPLSMLMLQLIVYLPPFYAAEMGLELAQVGFVFFLARAWDALIDPIIGNLSDRTRTRFGRRKPWILVGTPILMLATYAFGQPPHDIGFGYLLVTAFCFYVALTLVQIPYMSWGAELSRSYAGRTRVGGFREGGLMVGIVLATALPLLVLHESEPTVRDILRVFVLTVIILLPIAVAIATIITPAAPFNETGKRGLLQALGLLRRNRPLLRLLSGIFVLWLGGSMFNALVLFVVDRRLELSTTDFLWFVFVQYSLSVVMLPAAVWLGNRIGRHRALIVGGIGFLGLLPLFMLVPAGEFAAAMAVFVILGLLSNLIWVMPPALVSDTIEYGMMKGAGDDSAIYMALYLFVQKFALAAGVGIALPLAAWLGFDPTARSSPDGIAALDTVALILPGIIGLFGATILFNYPITAARHAVIRKWLQRKGMQTQN